MFRQMNIKNRTYCFYNDLINIKDFNARLLKLDKKKFNGSWYLLHRLCHKKSVSRMLIV